MVSLETLLAWTWAYRYFALFGVLFISAMGVPIPEEPVLLAGGLAVGWKHSDYWLTVLACLCGVLGGDLYIYWLGRRFGDRFLRTRLGRFTFGDKRHQQIERLYARHGQKTVFFGRFIPAVRFGVFFFAGQQRMPVLRFFTLNLGGALLNVPITVFLGVLAGRAFSDTTKAREHAEQLLREWQFWFFAALALVVAGVFLQAWRRKRRLRNVTGTTEACPTRATPEP
jgi:membrane protein DedA with SNARE-associated domain